MFITVTCCETHTHTHTHTRLTALFLGLHRWAGTRKVKPIWISLKQETVIVSGISWAICKSAPRSRQITMPAAHRSVSYRPNAIPAAQPTASKHWRQHMLQRNSKETILVSASASLRPLSASLPSKFHDFPGPNSFSRTFQVVEILQTQFQGPDLRNILRFIVKLS